MSADVDTILDRMALTCLQPGFVRFIITRKFAAAIAHHCKDSKVFGIAPYRVVRRGASEVVAEWRVDSLPVVNLNDA